MIEAFLLAGGLMGAQIKSMQRGDFNIYGSTSGVVQINPVDVDKSIVLVQSRPTSTGTNGVNTLTGLSSDQLAFSSVNTSGGTVSWVVLEFDGIEKVHRLNVSMGGGVSSTVRDVPEIKDKSKCFGVVIAATPLTQSNENAGRAIIVLDSYTEPQRVGLSRSVTSAACEFMVQLVEFK